MTKLTTDLLAMFNEMEKEVENREDAWLALYSEHFDTLWSHVSGEAEAPLPRNVFLVWDDTPSHEGSNDIGVRKYLTAYDWVAAMVLAAQKAFPDRGAMERFDFRLRILVIAAPDDYATSRSVKVMPLLQPAILPWVTLNMLEEAGQFKQALTSAETDSPPTLAQTFREPRLKGKMNAEFIKDLYRSELTKAGERHSVSNAIGPPALAQCLMDNGYSAADSVLRDWLEGEDSLRLTFWRFLELLGFLEPLKNNGDVEITQPALGGLAELPFIKEDLFGQFKHLRFALVDDQAAAGFHGALSAFLLGHDLESGHPVAGLHPEPAAVSHSKDGRFSLSSFQHPQVLLNWIRHTLEKTRFDMSHRPVFGRRNRYASAAAPVASIPEFDVLFLDLRLHGISGTSGERESESEWNSLFLDLVASFESLIDAYGLNFQQRRAFDTAVAAARMRSESYSNDEAVIGHLALLPILISICDPTMPIILFSSTRQKTVLDLFQPFPNIISTFAKPAITGYSKEDSSSLEATVDLLARALRESLILHEKRCLWDLIAEFDLKQAVPPTCVVQSGRIDPSMPYIESHDGKRYLANFINYDGKRKINCPFDVSIYYRTKLRSMILDYIVEDSSIEYLFKPYELFESSISSKHDSKYKSNIKMHFRDKDVNIFVRNKIISELEKRSMSIARIKASRHFVAHGDLKHNSNNFEENDNVRYASLAMIYNLLLGICSNSLKCKLDIFHAESNPLIQVMAQPPQVRNGVASGLLAKRVVDFANELWAKAASTRQSS